jgi:deoxycytidine triphosphate deaminase
VSFVNSRLLVQGKYVFVEDRKPPIEENQIQPSGIDLRIDYFTQIVGHGYLGVVEKKNSGERRLALKDGCYELEKGRPYMAYFVESCKLPIQMSALIWGRSTLVRNGILCLSMVYDPGYMNVIACPVYPFKTFLVKQYAKFAQFCGQENSGTMLYSGGYTLKEK